MIKRLTLYSILVLATALTSTGQVNNQKFEFSLEMAHPNAKLLMKEDFYWNPIDESGPFGSDAGSDAAYGFQKWRKSHPIISPILYLKQLLDSWNYPSFAWDELDTSKIKLYISAPGHNMGVSYLDEIDEAIIGTAFAQFVMEGKGDPRI